MASSDFKVPYQRTGFVPFAESLNGRLAMLDGCQLVAMALIWWALLGAKAPRQRLLRWGRRGRALRQRRRHSLQRCVRLIWFGLVVTMLVVEMVAVVLSLVAPLRAVLKLGWPTWSEMVRHSFRLLLVRHWSVRPRV